MTLDQFCALAEKRIPTPQEFVDFTRGMGWKIVVNGDGRAALRVPDSKDPLARTLARMLSREPYRTNVLRVVTGADPAPAKSATPPAADDDEWGAAEIATPAPAAVATVATPEPVAAVAAPAGKWPTPGATIECLWDDGTPQVYDRGLWPVRPVAWRYPGEPGWNYIREAVNA